MILVAILVFSLTTAFAEELNPGVKSSKMIGEDSSEKETDSLYSLILRTLISNREVIDGISYSDFKNAMMKAHNKRRNDAYAENMRQLRWSEDLAKYAQKYADQCKIKHNPEHLYGENIMIGSIVDNLDLPVELWIDEEEKYKNDDGDLVSRCDGKCGHLTQALWYDLKLLGCGYKRCDPTKDKRYFVVCNYSPAGNVRGEPAYIKAPNEEAINSLCSEIQSKPSKSKKYGHLCKTAPKKTQLEPNQYY